MKERLVKSFNEFVNEGRVSFGNPYEYEEGYDLVRDEYIKPKKSTTQTKPRVSPREKILIEDALRYIEENKSPSTYSNQMLAQSILILYYFGSYTRNQLIEMVDGLRFVMKGNWMNSFIIFPNGDTSNSYEYPFIRVDLRTPDIKDLYAMIGNLTYSDLGEYEVKFGEPF
jgi:hypothetical protein